MFQAAELSTLVVGLQSPQPTHTVWITSTSWSVLVTKVETRHSKNNFLGIETTSIPAAGMYEIIQSHSESRTVIKNTQLGASGGSVSIQPMLPVTG